TKIGSAAQLTITGNKLIVLDSKPAGKIWNFNITLGLGGNSSQVLVPLTSADAPVEEIYENLDSTIISHSESASQPIVANNSNNYTWATILAAFLIIVVAALATKKYLSKGA